MAILHRLIRDSVRRRVEELELEFNAYGLDPYGIDKRELALMFSVFEPLYKKYFRVNVHGIEHVPECGRGMLVGNHSGGYAIDAMMTLASMFFEMNPPRIAHGMAEKFLNRIPFASLYTAKTGNVPGLPENARHMLEHERLLMVFPEGARGTAKLYPDRHSLVDFGSGFMRLALQTGSPIIPFGFVGGGDAIPTVANLYKLGKLFGMPYIPVTPYLLPLPRPTQLEIVYGEPIYFEGRGDEEDVEIYGFVDQVKRAIANLIEQGVRLRSQR